MSVAMGLSASRASMARAWLGGRSGGDVSVVCLRRVAAWCLTHVWRLDHRFGSGRVCEQVVQLLHHEASAVMRGSYSERIGKALFGALAQVSWLAGSMASDVGRQSLAQHYYIRTLNLAMGAGG
jgi:hypothetical protein